MPFELSKDDARGKTEILAFAREKHTVLCAQIDAFNAMLDAARSSIGAAQAEYVAAVRQLEEFAEKTAAEQGAALAAKSGRFRQGGVGAAVRDWIASYAGFKPVVPRVEVPEEIEAPDDELLSHFEELPDCP